MHNIQGYYNLVAAIIKKAIYDYHRKAKPTHNERVRAYINKYRRSAYVFFNSTGSQNGRRFENLCDWTGASADYIREKAKVKARKRR